MYVLEKIIEKMLLVISDEIWPDTKAVAYGR